MTVYIGEGDQLSADSSAAGLLVLAGIHALLNAVPTSRLGGGLSASAATITNAVADVDGERALLDLMCSAPRLLIENLQRHRLSAVKHGTCALRAGVDTWCMRPACAANPRGVEAIALLDLGPGEGVCPLWLSIDLLHRWSHDVGAGAIGDLGRRDAMTAIRRLAGGSRTCRLRAMSAVVAVVLATALGSVSASAADDGWTRSTNSYEFVQWDCGYPVRVVGTESHVVKTKVDKKLPGVSYVTDRFEFSEVWTAPDGRWFTLSGHGVNKDKKGRLVGGSVYQFAYVVRGQPMTITDSSGVVVLRDRGTLTFDYTIDLADGTFTFLGVRIRGPHPIFDAGVCKSAAPLIGTDSARHLTPRPIGSTSFPMGFYEYLPPSYQAAGSKSPLLLAFNGYGENGDGTAAGLTTLLGTGIPRFIDIGGWPTDRPLVVLALQHVEAPPGFDFSPCDGVEWGGSCSMQLQHDRNNASPAFCTTPDEIHDFITYAVAHYNVDPARVYVTGLSCGAYGVWEYLAKYGNEQVAAAVPIAGDGRPAWPANICGLSSVALWAFHGAVDDVINPNGSIEPTTKLAACPGVSADRAKLTVYPDLFHDGWDQAYSGSLGDDIYTWMLGFSKQ